MLIVLKHKEPKDATKSAPPEGSGSIPVTTGTQTDQGDPESIPTVPAEEEELR